MRAVSKRGQRDSGRGLPSSGQFLNYAPVASDAEQAPQQRRAFFAYDGAPVAEFLATAPKTVIGVLAMADMRGTLDAESAARSGPWPPR